MQQYKMSFLDKLDFVVTVRDFDADNDVDALTHAHVLCKTHTINVTQADRRVGEVAKGAAAGPPLPRRLGRIFAGPRRVPAAAAVGRPQAPVLSPAEAAARNYARMHGAALARERRMVDKH